eukprot:TRINITY_DN3123_c0_g1_i1.p4 TRINITY_DN3123_c0_g1~~TRINITY_DN3123_c0_g1_i1.p4  ORF type:complete len:124 (+),score=6.35 TRINITY_DN3123_c0_g1_i1:429-800(+)
MCAAFGLVRYTSRDVRPVLDVQRVVGRWRLQVFGCWQAEARAGAVRRGNGRLGSMRWMFGRCRWCLLGGDGCRFRCDGGACSSDCILRGRPPHNRTCAVCVWVLERAVVSAGRWRWSCCILVS